MPPPYDRGGGSLAEQGTGRGWEAGVQGAGSGIYMRVGSKSRSKGGDSLLFITGYYSVNINKQLPSKVLKFPFNIHQCLKGNFGSKKM